MKTQLIKLLTSISTLITANPQNLIETDKGKRAVEAAMAELSNATPMDADLRSAIETVAELAAAALPQVPESGNFAYPEPRGVSPAPANDGLPTHEAPRPGSGEEKPHPIKQE